MIGILVSVTALDLLDRRSPGAIWIKGLDAPVFEGVVDVNGSSTLQRKSHLDYYEWAWGDPGQLTVMN